MYNKFYNNKGELMDKVKSIKISIAVTGLFILLLGAFIIGLPWMVTWYVEKMGRSQTLAATVLISCYICAPFVGSALFFLRKLLKNVLKIGLLNEMNFMLLKKITVCCIIISFVTLIAGNFYMPFFLVSATFVFVAILLFGLRAALYVTVREEKAESEESDKSEEIEEISQASAETEI